MALKLENKRILLGITGGIAAYKSAELCRALTKEGAEVRVVMTQGAQEFITPLTLQALSGNPVHTSLLDPDAEAGMGHIELAKWPDLIMIAPATAHFIAQLAQGMAGDLLLTTLLASEAPIALAPAMNQAMWRHPLTQHNMQHLTAVMMSRLHVIGPQDGEQACGDVGPGRMEEPASLLSHIVGLLAEQRAFERLCAKGLRVTITAGPTREAIDPVRYISNHSSGKMGFALAEAFQSAGADVSLIAGPVSLAPPPGVELLAVESAAQMHSEALNACRDGCDIFIAAAAVADYRVESPSDQKIKKSGQAAMQICLTRNPDIVADVASLDARPFTVGFAAETQDVLAYARDKMLRKNLDMIIANDVSREDIGFNADQNEVIVLTRKQEQYFERQNKQLLAGRLMREIVGAYKGENMLDE